MALHFFYLSRLFRLIITCFIGWGAFVHGCGVIAVVEDIFGKFLGVEELAVAVLEHPIFDKFMLIWNFYILTVISSL